MNERIRELAEQAGYEKDMFGIGHWDMPECKKFAESIIEQCVSMCGSQADKKNISLYFGLSTEPDVLYPAAEESWSVKSQYSREYNFPK
jgi:hypothetical protein